MRHNAHDEFSAGHGFLASGADARGARAAKNNSTNQAE
jgi:hypothetical protein